MESSSTFYQPINVKDILNPLEEQSSSPEYLKLSQQLKEVDQKFCLVDTQFNEIYQRLLTLEESYAD